MARASGIMLLHYMGYIGSMLLLWLLMVSSALKNLPIVQTALLILLLISSLLFGAIGLLYVARGGRRGGKE